MQYNELRYHNQNLLNIFNLLDALQVLYVLEDVKRVTRILLHESKLNQAEEFLNNNDCYIEKSDFKIIPKTDANKGNYANTGTFVETNSAMEGKLYIYISKKREYALLAKMYEAISNDLSFGRLLGYPECCCQFFVKHKFKQANKQYDFILPAVRFFKPFPFYNNYAIRYFGITLINHFPCSLDYQKSAEQGRIRLKIIKKYSQQIADEFERELKSLVIYTEDQGMFYTPDYAMEGGVLVYKHIRKTTSNQLYQLLSKCNKIKVEDFNHFHIGEYEMKSEDIAIMMFS